MGASLLAKGRQPEHQCRLSHRFREQARSYRERTNRTFFI
ncbi:hypothetical protein OU5_4693 [Pseudomonas mandelii JR-1]|uniref:Uncharacterized protein n=1 Tax=Pseudomonas mandelii JR-1 TaxID=1147786 RepID=A0A024EG72_9PSED|nr:hypothetical protein OU5_4693 [Pseudomonas mandelii JR-1]